MEVTQPQNGVTARNFGCRICGEAFTSRYLFQIHINGHQPFCPQECNLGFETWEEVVQHLAFCPRKFGVVDRRPLNQPRAPRQPPRPFRCQLCRRTYETYRHLFRHQVQRCKKRYRTRAWVVKI